MSTFPPLTPTARSWVAGQLPMQAFVGMAGNEMRVVTGNQMVGQGLSLTFANLLEADANLIVAHYNGQLGGFMAFEAPAEVFAGWGSGQISSKPAGNRWRYAGAPNMAFVAPGIVTVTVDLLAVSD
jgi:hypothetical protein